jgi:hypothetical protein
VRHQPSLPHHKLTFGHSQLVSGQCFRSAVDSIYPCGGEGYFAPWNSAALQENSSDYMCRTEDNRHTVSGSSAVHTVSLRNVTNK